MARYTLKRAELGDRWDMFVKSSPNGTLFSYSPYLEAIGVDVGLWYCMKGEQVKAAFAVVEPTPRHAELDDLVVYNGLMHQAPEPDQNVSQVRSERFKVATFVAEELARHYHSLAFQLHPSVVDVRPWLWVSYGLDALKHYRVDVRYTSHLDIQYINLPYEEDPLQRVSQSRRQQIGYAKRDGIFTLRYDYQLDKLLYWYRVNMAGQDNQVSIHFEARLRELLKNLNRAELTRWFASYISEGHCGALAVYGVDNKRAYWLWGASNPEIDCKSAGTAVVWDAMCQLAEDGVKEVDLEGVNSPQRGWFKLSFGGTLEPYWQVRLE